MKAGLQSSIAPAAEDEPQLIAKVHRDPFGKALYFTLIRGNESITLEPGSTWAQTDQFKWVMRGCLEEPHSYHVQPDGTVEMNGRRIRLLEPKAEEKLLAEITRRQAPTLSPSTAARSTGGPGGNASGPTGTVRVRFKVRLDRLGHLMIDCVHGTEHLETSLRGLQGLVHNGFMLPPKSLHIEPLQKHIEIDGAVFEADEGGARRLEETLNERYAAVLSAEREGAIEVKENEAAATGFDIHFSFVRAGARFDVRGHLDQERLELLNDPQHCDLLNPGIVIRLSPPLLVVRKRQPDGGEHPLPQFPDLEYHRTTANHLQRLFNHPLIRRSSPTSSKGAAVIGEGTPELVEIRVVRHEAQKSMLWLDCIPAEGEAPICRAFTHHNVADLQYSGAFLLQYDVALSLDNGELSVLNTENKQVERIVLDAFSTDADLEKASRMLTRVLRPAQRHAKPAPPAEPREAKSPEPPVAAETPDPEREPPEPALPLRLAPPPEPPLDPAIHALFGEQDPIHINSQVFARLAEDLPIEVAHVCLSLPHVFDDRHFELLCFEDVEIGSVFDLRGPNFYGFYLTHLADGAVDLVFACRGLHLEWTRNRCVLQTAANSDPIEFAGHALRGLAENADSHFVFIVEPAFKEWVQPFEESCAQAFAHFVTVREYAAEAEAYALVWPLPAAAEPING
jgi:hypothetical protein